MQKEKDKTHFSFLIAFARQLDEALGREDMEQHLALLRAGLATVLDIHDEGAGDVDSGPDEVSYDDDDDPDGVGDALESLELDGLRSRLEELEERLHPSRPTHLGGAVPGTRPRIDGSRERVGRPQAIEPAVNMKKGAKRRAKTKK